MTIESMKKKVAARGQGGFTLIELLVVIAILAVLAGVVVFAVGNSTKNAQQVACSTERAAIITANAAAETAYLVDQSSTWRQYLKSDLEYFAPDVEAAPTAFSRLQTGVFDDTKCTAFDSTAWR